jgi:hypothetical protein
MNKKEQLAEQIAEKHLGKKNFQYYGTLQKQGVIAAIVEAMGEQETKFTTILLPKEIKSVQELGEQITAHPDLWNVLSVYEAAKTLANNEAANILLKLSNNEIRTLSLYYSIKP